MGREDEKETVLKICREHKLDIHPYDGVAEVIEVLRTKGIKIGIITDGRPKGQKNKIEALDLDVDDVIITDELGGTQFRKPCDIAFRVLQTKWRLAPSQMVYVADNPAKDFQTSQQLGMKSVYFKNEDGLYSHNEIIDIPSITKMQDLI